MLALGFSSGLPFLLVFSTQSAWLREAGVAREHIGLMSWVALAYSFKFLWAPLLDRYDAPLLGRWLGRRRGWMALTQIAVACCLVGLSFGDPAHNLLWTIVFAFCLGFFSATQDVVIDGGASPSPRPNSRARCRRRARSATNSPFSAPAPARFISPSS